MTNEVQAEWEARLNNLKEEFNGDTDKMITHLVLMQLVEGQQRLQMSESIGEQSKAIANLVFLVMDLQREIKELNSKLMVVGSNEQRH